KTDRVRHPDIGDDQIRAMGGRGEETLPSVGRAQNIIAPRFQANSESVSDSFIIFDHEYLFAVTRDMHMLLVVGTRIGLSMRIDRLDRGRSSSVQSVSDCREQLLRIVRLFEKCHRSKLP